ncbi:MAG: PLP-dependent aminotransferase family protein [Anaerolineae bacterium]|nr:PLP-dependent aminotransferase family protein [Anaerolineae bacterium]
MGAAQAVDLTLRTLAPVTQMAVEEPGAEPVRRLAHLYNIPLLPVPVDENGMRVDCLAAQATPPALVHVVPSHHYPTGWALSLERRKQLLAWAARNGSIIIEDDYDSEFRFDRLPPIALAALDPSQQVVYIGTFSKTIFPGLRLGFCLLPERFISAFLDLKWFSDRCVPVLEQLTLADWLESGLFERHVRKMRRVYAERRECLLNSLHQYFGDGFQALGLPAGMHICTRFDLGKNENELLSAALANGVKVYPASVCYQDPPLYPPAVILGYGHLSPDAIQQGVKLLAGAWRSQG